MVGLLFNPYPVQISDFMCGVNLAASGQAIVVLFLRHPLLAAKIPTPTPALLKAI